MKTFIGLLLLVASLHPQGAAQESTREIRLKGETWNWDCRGTARPAVVFESGVGSSAEAWKQVRDAVGEFALACTYLRPKSEAGFEQRSADLKKLLELVGEQHPVVLVGHSHGGYVVRLFAASYPQLTAGLVLVDPTPESLSLEAEGLMPEDHRQMWIQSEAEIRKKLQDSKLPDRPLVILSSEQTGIPPAMAEGYQLDRLLEIGLRLRESMAARVPRGEHRFLKGTGHFIHRDRPEAVVEAIRKVWQDSAKSNPPQSSSLGSE